MNTTPRVADSEGGHTPRHPDAKAAREQARGQLPTRRRDGRSKSIWNSIGYKLVKHARLSRLRE